MEYCTFADEVDDKQLKLIKLLGSGSVNVMDFTPHLVVCELPDDY